ncbi:dihydroxyacetone kinase family protein [Rhodococcus sp. 14-1411-2a]|uniref:dihydroxyacetone kinase family protein n=1 Tax=Rhodococcus sp. 14-1411-2a TaxID=2023151 RepID=UPI000B9AF6F5|nr:dihydroxyacetone kinase family protein [Rhodococcus sp. 14-1411-2a]OZF47971.1 dihydroxyacetone kinase subunit DhaK [Rhodococcus sp. 14-1411-2a]
MFSNSPRTFVADALRGFVAATDDVTWHADPGFLTRRYRISDGQVALLSGGGSGHEPLHAGFIGRGMLTGACPGLIFTSPNALQVHEASKAVDSGGGVLHIVKNYTGDVMNFMIARELLQEDGIAADVVLVDDDVASESEDGPGRRGTAATIVVEKVCGAAAERGDSLQAVVALGRRTAENARSMAVALNPPTLPGADEPSFELPKEEIELGIGIHGERGTDRVSQLPAREIVEKLTEPIVDSLGLNSGETVIAIVNGLGATHPLELHLLFGELSEYLHGKGIEISRSLVGSFVTALNMGGASITLVRADDEMLELWDAPTDAPGWPNASSRGAKPVAERGAFGPTFTPSDTGDRSAFVSEWIGSWAQRVLDEEPALTELDRKAGDGDFGTNMVAALEQLDLDAVKESYSAATVFEAVSEAYLGHAGGTSGALFGIWFRQFYRTMLETEPDLAAIGQAARAGLDSITELGGARVGDKTMVDAIAPAVDALEKDGGTLQDAADAAKSGAESTNDITANRGRASYVGEAARGVVDPGALVMAWFFEAAAGSTPES